MKKVLKVGEWVDAKTHQFEVLCVRYNGDITSVKRLKDGKIFFLFLMKTNSSGKTYFISQFAKDMKTVCVNFTYPSGKTNIAKVMEINSIV